MIKSLLPIGLALLSAVIVAAHFLAPSVFGVQLSTNYGLIAIHSVILATFVAIILIGEIKRSGKTTLKEQWDVTSTTLTVATIFAVAVYFLAGLRGAENSVNGDGIIAFMLVPLLITIGFGVYYLVDSRINKKGANDVATTDDTSTDSEKATKGSEYTLDTKLASLMATAIYILLGIETATALHRGFSGDLFTWYTLGYVIGMVAIAAWYTKPDMSLSITELGAKYDKQQENTLTLVVIASLLNVYIGSNDPNIIVMINAPLYLFLVARFPIGLLRYKYMKRKEKVAETE